MPGSKHALIAPTVGTIRRWGLRYGSRIAVPCLGTAAAALGLHRDLGVRIVHASDTSAPILAVLRALRDRPAATVAAARRVVETVLNAATAEESTARFNAIRAELNTVVPEVGRPTASALARLEAAVLEAAAPELGPVAAPAVVLALWRMSAQRILRVAYGTARLNSPPRWSARTPRPSPEATLPEAALRALGSELGRCLPLPVFADVFDVLVDASPGLEGTVGGLDWVYADPPYAGTWGAYTSERFDQVRLIQCVRECRVPVVLHNAAGPIALERGAAAPLRSWVAHYGTRPGGQNVVVEEATLWRSGRVQARGPRTPVAEALLLTRPGAPSTDEAEREAVAPAPA